MEQVHRDSEWLKKYKSEHLQLQTFKTADLGGSNNGPKEILAPFSMHHTSCGDDDDASNEMMIMNRK